MAGNPGDAYPFHACGPLVKAKRIGCRYTELVLAQAGRNIRMGFGVHIGVDSKSDRRPFAKAKCYCIHTLELCLGFQTEITNPGAKRLLNFSH